MPMAKIQQRVKEAKLCLIFVVVLDLMVLL